MFRFFENRVKPYPEQAIETPPRGFYAFLWVGSQGVRGHILLMTLLAAWVGAFEALLFAMLGYLVDWLNEIGPVRLWTEQGNTLLCLGLLVLASAIVVAFHAMIKNQSLAGNFPMRLRWNYHRLMLGQSLGFFQGEFAGRVAAKVMQTALAVRDIWMILADILVYVGIYFATMVLVVGNFDRWMLLPFLLWFVVYVLLLCFFVPRMVRVSRRQADARSLMTGRITDAYANIATVKLFSHAGREAEYTRSAMQDFLKTVHAQMRLISGMEITVHAISMFLILGTVALSLWLWSAGEIGVGAVAAATAMAMRLNGMSHWVMWEMSILFEQVGTVQDGLNTLTRHRAVVDKADAPPLRIERGEICFEDVSFSYGREDAVDAAVITHFSLRVHPGEKLGLVGRSGAGKSTCVNLLLRFYDVEQGRILIDGQNIADVSQESLRAQIGMVTQDTSLLHRSVRENLFYGRPEASDSEMRSAAKRAEAQDFITGLSDPTGRREYDVLVGERGVKLSGGQRQRIAIARVILKNAPILLLDEATSALDSEVEAAIQSSLDQLMENKTVVAIAHRLSTIAAMDRLVVLDKGRIVEEGSHQSLLAQGGIYARLWAYQSGGFLGTEIEAAQAEEPTV